MTVDYLIVGQGLCGTWLSYYLLEAGASVLVIDQPKPFTASKVASGIINPVTGRRIVKTWMIDELMPFAWKAYLSIGQQLGITCISNKPVIDFFPSPQMRLAFLDRYASDKSFLSMPVDEHDWLPFMNYDFGYGIIQPAYLIDNASLLDAWSMKLQQPGMLLTEELRFDAVEMLTDGVKYGDLYAGKIIFCDGVAGYNNPFFPHLPYGLNKGERLLVEIPGFPRTNIIKKGYSLVPWKEDVFWLGSTYLWEFDNDQPTPGFYQFAENWLRQTVKMNYRIVDHAASVRPATLERKPFVGLHPANPRVGILNGMGTKGCSLAPFFARQLAENLLAGKPILAEAAVTRFARTLTR